MKHKITLTAEKLDDFYHTVQSNVGFIKPANKWLNDNLPQILTTEPLVVTDEMAETVEKFHREFGPLSTKKLLQHFAYVYVNTHLPKVSMDEILDRQERDHAPFIVVKPETFVVDGKTFTRHKPGDPMPCDGERKVDYAFKDGATSRWPSFAQELRWSNEDDECDIIGWRYADTPKDEQPSEDDTLRKELVEIKGWLQSANASRDNARASAHAWEQTAIKARAKVGELEAKNSHARLLPITDPMPSVVKECIRVFWGEECGTDWVIHSKITHYGDFLIPEPAPQPDPEADLRREFEEAMKIGKESNWNFDRDKGAHEYSNPFTQCAFDGWMRCKELAKGIKP